MSPYCSLRIFGVHVTYGTGPTNPENLNLNQFNVFSLAIVSIIKAIAAWVPQMAEATSLGMLFSMNRPFSFQRG